MDKNGDEETDPIGDNGEGEDEVFARSLQTSVELTLKSMKFETKKIKVGSIDIIFHPEKIEVMTPLQTVHHFSYYSIGRLSYPVLAYAKRIIKVNPHIILLFDFEFAQLPTEAQDTLTLLTPFNEPQAFADSLNFDLNALCEETTIDLVHLILSSDGQIADDNITVILRRFFVKLSIPLNRGGFNHLNFHKPKQILTVILNSVRLLLPTNNVCYPFEFFKKYFIRRMQELIQQGLVSEDLIPKNTFVMYGNATELT
jgi:hypothetical protein